MIERIICDNPVDTIRAIEERRAELEEEFLNLKNAYDQRAFEIVGELGELSAEEDYQNSRRLIRLMYEAIQSNQ